LRVRAPSHGPNGGVADSLDDAKAAREAVFDSDIAAFGIANVSKATAE
jgi:hypothetical protein